MRELPEQRERHAPRPQLLASRGCRAAGAPNSDSEPGHRGGAVRRRRLQVRLQPLCSQLPRPAEPKGGDGATVRLGMPRAAGTGSLRRPRGQARSSRARWARPEPAGTPGAAGGGRNGLRAASRGPTVSMRPQRAWHDRPERREHLPDDAEVGVDLAVGEGADELRARAVARLLAPQQAHPLVLLRAYRPVLRVEDLQHDQRLPPAVGCGRAVLERVDGTDKLRQVRLRERVHVPVSMSEQWHRRREAQLPVGQRLVRGGVLTPRALGVAEESRRQAQRGVEGLRLRRPAALGCAHAIEGTECGGHSRARPVGGCDEGLAPRDQQQFAVRFRWPRSLQFRPLAERTSSDSPPHS